MKHKLIMALLMLGISIPLCAQGDNTAKGKSAYPKITAEDLASCKKEIANLHREEINWLKISTERYCNPPRQEKIDQTDNCRKSKKWVSESSSESDLAWFMKGNDSCAEDGACYGLRPYNENPNEDSIDKILKMSVPVFDEKKERAEYRRDNADSSPSQYDAYDENESVQRGKLILLSWVADQCIAKIWVAKRDGKTSVAAAGKQPGEKPAGNSTQANDGGSISPVAGSSRLSQQQITACTEDIKRKQVESQSWGGDVNAIANRLGKYQKELFEGRCAGHPEAQAYLAGANKMLGYGGSATGSGGKQQMNSGATEMEVREAATGKQAGEKPAGNSTGGPEYVRIQSNKKCATYKVTETPPDAVSKFRKVVFGIKNTCDIPMYIGWSIYEGKRETLSVDFPLQLDLTPERRGYFKPGETLISKPFSVSGRDSVKIVFNLVCPIESEASKMAGKPLGHIRARPEQPDLCIGLVLKPTDVPTAK